MRKPEGPAEAPDHELTAALDGAAAMLRVLARSPLTDETAQASAALEGWARHLLLLVSPEGDPPVPVPRRNWRGLVRHVATHRQGELDEVSRSKREAKEAILALLQGLAQACTDRGKSDTELRGRIKHFTESVAVAPLEALRQEATEFAAVVVRALEEQQRRADDNARVLRHRLSNLEEQLTVAKREGGTDPLTKLANRRTFDAMLGHAATLSGALGRPACLVIADIDHFKSINDGHGHPAGDAVLRAVADRLARCFPRRSDLVARYGGEEFACVLPETSLVDARRLVTRMIDAVRGTPVTFEGATLEVTISAGVGELLPGEPPAELVSRVDRALYEAKRAGRDRFVEARSPSGTQPAVRVARAG